MRTLAVLLIAVAVASPACQSTMQQQAPACACTVEADGTLVVPWDCYCAQAACGERLPAAGDPSCAPVTRTDYPECGLTTLSIVTAGGPYLRVFDASGQLVGVQSGSDTADYSCPSNPAQSSLVRRSGRFPAGSCRAVTCAPGTCAPCAQDAGGAD